MRQPRCFDLRQEHCHDAASRSVADRPRLPVGLRPDVADFFRQATPDILDLAFRYLFGQQLEHSHDGLCRLRQRISPEGLVYSGDKILDVASLDGGRGRPPLFIVGSAQQLWKLGAEVDRLVHPQGIAQRVKHGLKQAIAARFIIPV